MNIPIFSPIPSCKTCYSCSMRNCLLPGACSDRLPFCWQSCLWGEHRTNRHPVAERTAEIRFVYGRLETLLHSWGKWQRGSWRWGWRARWWRRPSRTLRSRQRRRPCPRWWGSIDHPASEVIVVKRDAARRNFRKKTSASHSRGDLLRAVPWLTLRWKLQILSYFYSFQSFQSIFGLYMMKQYVVKLRKLFPQFYTGFCVFDVTPW